MNENQQVIIDLPSPLLGPVAIVYLPTLGIQTVGVIYFVHLAVGTLRWQRVMPLPGGSP